MLRFMLDTNLCIRVLRDRPPVMRRFNECAGELCISTVALMELLHGAAASSRPDHNRREVGRMASRLQVLACDEAAATHAANCRPCPKPWPANRDQQSWRIPPCHRTHA
jgi:tRNA(fMet)-specific endonuclease VapC